MISIGVCPAQGDPNTGPLRGVSSPNECFVHVNLPGLKLYAALITIIRVNIDGIIPFMTLRKRG